MQSILIQEYSGEFKNDVIELILDIQRNEFGIPIVLEDQLDLTTIPISYQRGNGNFWIALYQGKLVGTIALIDIENQQAALKKMFVKKEFRGAQYKIAQSLLNTLFMWAQIKKLTDIYLGTTDKYHAAHRFYEKNEFVLIEKQQLPQTFSIMNVDSIFYWHKM